jgi:nucleoside-diphosphate-sugar epimerase
VRRPELAPRAWHTAGVRLLKSDLGDAASLARAIEGARRVVHLATGGGERWEDFERVMIGGTRAIAEACLAARVEQLVYTSSSAAYYLGDEGTTVTEETPLDSAADRRGFYARAKILCERILGEMHRTRALPVVIVRPAIVLGDSGTFRHSGLGLWTRDNHVIGWGAGTNPLPLVLADDVVDALARVLDRSGLAGESFNLAGDVSMSARELVAAIAERSGRPIVFHAQALWKSQSIELAKWLIKKAIRRPGAIFPSAHDLRSRAMRARFDCARAKRVLGWRPESDRVRFLERAFGWLAPPPPTAEPVPESIPQAAPETSTR